MANSDLIRDLHSLIDFIEENPDFDFTRGGGKITGCFPVTFGFRLWYLRSDENHKEVLADLVRRMGNVEKKYSGDFLGIDKVFGSTVEFHVGAERTDVCERVVVGKKLVPAHEEYVIPASPEHEEDIVEWNCHPILAAEEESVTA